MDEILLLGFIVQLNVTSLTYTSLMLELALKLVALVYSKQLLARRTLRRKKNSQNEKKYCTYIWEGFPVYVEDSSLIKHIFVPQNVLSVSCY